MVEALALLRTPPDGREAVYREADRVRAAVHGEEVFIRGIVEFSNHCARNCAYCGIRRDHRAVRRYQLDEEGILAACRGMERHGHTTVVLQSGESPAFGDGRLGGVIRRIKEETALAVTVSAGVKSEPVYRAWRAAGMDRYLLRFETSDPDLYARLHPDSTLGERLAALETLRALGVQLGSGFLIGVPGETLSVLARNVALCRALDLDMVGVGPFIPHPGTPLGTGRNAYADDPDVFFLAIAALRILHPRAHLPATTAYDAAFPGGGRDLALQRGANVFMPNHTPAPHRRDYLLYPGKPCIDESGEDCAGCVAGRLLALGRRPGRGPGHALRRAAPAGRGAEGGKRGPGGVGERFHPVPPAAANGRSA